jgi:hypothetical protein
LHVHGSRDAAGRWSITDLYLHGKALSVETMRGISIPKLEAALARMARDPQALANISGDDDESLTIGKLRERSGQVAAMQRELGRHGEARAPLGRPDGMDPEVFYARVARAYGEYAEQTHAPARAMAEEADVPVGTVHRWIREARRRGFLPPARKGRVG